MYKGKTVFITGTNRGLGKALVKGFASKGANIIAHSRKFTEEWNHYLEEIKTQFSVGITTIIFDLNNFAEIEESFKSLYKKKINIDILINNAGVAHGGLFMLTKIDTIKEIFEINVFAQMKITQLALKIMSKNKEGCIINISSIFGLDLKAGNSAYGVSKATINAWTKTLASECASYGIRVLSVAPTLIDTDMAKEMNDKNFDEIIKLSVLKRMATTEEIVNSILCLTSTEAAYINGQVVRLDGGMA